MQTVNKIHSIILSTIIALLGFPAIADPSPLTLDGVPTAKEMAKIQLDRAHHFHDQYEHAIWEEIKHCVISTGRYDDEIRLDLVSSDFFTRVNDAYTALGYDVEFENVERRPYKEISIWY